jgi:hypothetical protein
MLSLSVGVDNFFDSALASAVLQSAVGVANRAQQNSTAGKQSYVSRLHDLTHACAHVITYSFKAAPCRTSNATQCSCRLRAVSRPPGACLSEPLQGAALGRRSSFHLAVLTGSAPLFNGVLQSATVLLHDS